MIVAPITVGDGAVTAAGTVATQDIPADTLVAGVPAKVKKHLKEQSEPEVRRPPRTELTPEESHQRASTFDERKEKFIASITQGQD
jgi:serine acetyltransferase